MGAVQAARSEADRLRASGLGRFFEKWGRDSADDHAALIAFSTLFSIFPLLGALLTLLGFLLRDPATLAQVSETISRQFPSEVGGMLDFLQQTRQISGLLGIVSFVGLLWSASAIFGSMARAFNRFYGVRDRGFFGQRLMAFIMIFVFLGLTIVSVVAASAATFLLGFSADRSPIPLPDLGPLQSALGWGISLASALLLFLAVYRVVPNAPLSLGRVWRGALLAAVLFILLNQLFPLYLRFLGGGFAAYKTLGLFLLLMTWFYFLARILVLGCELNTFLRPLPPEARPSPEPPPAPAPPSRLGRLAGRALSVGALLLAALVVARPRRRS